MILPAGLPAKAIPATCVPWEYLPYSPRFSKKGLKSSFSRVERFFLYSEEPDLCLRIKRAGWSVRHLPTMTVIHHAGKGGIRPKLRAQEAFARRQYARKHFAAPHRFAYLAAIASGHLLRAGLFSRGQQPDCRVAARLALRTLAGLTEPPYGHPPRAALLRPVRREP